MVYVDDLNLEKNGRVWSHMAADSLDELHEMADKIGLKREWFQDRPHFPHYDVTEGKKRLAIKNGAILLGVKDMVRWNHKRLKESGV